MKKYTYEITIEAQDESEADTRMRGLSLLTACTVVQKKPGSTLLPLDAREEEIIRIHRRGKKVLHLLKSCIENPSHIDTLEETLKK